MTSMPSSPAAPNPGPKDDSSSRQDEHKVKGSSEIDATGSLHPRDDAATHVVNHHKVASSSRSVSPADRRAMGKQQHLESVLKPPPSPSIPAPLPPVKTRRKSSSLEGYSSSSYSEKCRTPDALLTDPRIDLNYFGITRRQPRVAPRLASKRSISSSPSSSISLPSSTHTTPSRISLLQHRRRRGHNRHNTIDVAQIRDSSSSSSTSPARKLYAHISLVEQRILQHRRQFEQKRKKRYRQISNVKSEMDMRRRWMQHELVAIIQKQEHIREALMSVETKILKCRISILKRHIEECKEKVKRLVRAPSSLPSSSFSYSASSFAVPPPPTPTPSTSTTTTPTKAVRAGGIITSSGRRRSGSIPNDIISSSSSTSSSRHHHSVPPGLPSHSPPPPPRPGCDDLAAKHEMKTEGKRATTAKEAGSKEREIKSSLDAACLESLALQSLVSQEEDLKQELHLAGEDFLVTHRKLLKVENVPRRQRVAALLRSLDKFYRSTALYTPAPDLEFEFDCFISDQRHAEGRALSRWIDLLEAKDPRSIPPGKVAVFLRQFALGFIKEYGVGEGALQKYVHLLFGRVILRKFLHTIRIVDEFLVSRENIFKKKLRWMRHLTQQQMGIPPIFCCPIDDDVPRKGKGGGGAGGGCSDKTKGKLKELEQVSSSSPSSSSSSLPITTSKVGEDNNNNNNNDDDDDDDDRNGNSSSPSSLPTNHIDKALSCSFVFGDKQPTKKQHIVVVESSYSSNTSNSTTTPSCSPPAPPPPPPPPSHHHPEEAKGGEIATPRNVRRQQQPYNAAIRILEEACTLTAPEDIMHAVLHSARNIYTLSRRYSVMNAINEEQVSSAAAAAAAQSKKHTSPSTISSPPPPPRVSGRERQPPADEGKQQRIVAEEDKHHTISGEPPPVKMGADSFFPILLYVVTHGDLHRLHRAIHLVKMFGRKEDASSEKMYYMTAVEGALHFVASANPQDFVDGKTPFESGGKSLI